MKSELKDALAAYLLALGDDELILGHRDSEWCGHAPILEEDIAFANIALDEIGHAVMWYSYLADLLEQEHEKYPNQLVYHRDMADFRCIQFVELPKGDWAFSMLRQYLFDVAEKLRLEALANSQHLPLAEAAAKMRAEEVYHLRHTQAWVRRLGLGTDESNRRMQTALDVLWSYALAQFQPLPDESLLVHQGYIPDSCELEEKWRSIVTTCLEESGLKIPFDKLSVNHARNQHSPHLPDLLQELQEVARLFPGAEW